jgi:soluble lytic murein transglycosylase-like protein
VQSKLKKGEKMDRTFRHGLISLIVFLVLLALLVIAFNSFGAQPMEISERYRCNTAECASQMILYKVRAYPGHPAYPTSKRLELGNLFATEARAKEIPVAIVAAISFRESSFLPASIGYKAKEIGLMQVHPSTARTWGCKAMHTPEGQVKCGCKILRDEWDKCGSLFCALSAYASKGNYKPVRGGKLWDVVQSRFRLADRMEAFALASVDPKNSAHSLE